MSEINKVCIGKDEIEGNKHCYGCLKICFISLIVALLLNEIGVFVVNKLMMRVSVFITLLLVTGILCYIKKIGFEHKNNKYILMSTILIVIYIMSVCLTYNIVLVQSVQHNDLLYVYMTK